MKRIVDKATGIWVNIFPGGRVQIGSYSTEKPVSRDISNGGPNDQPRYWTHEVIVNTSGSRKPVIKTTDTVV